ncbi:hypothetical protein [Paracoccus pantotrophus]|uniref:hypothetical protein n=1 Tax=Paracoccus pantotrophus TaxID=82367 RepID=UPI0012DF607D|nr:hypothetical protein [Paracoccus pantotrophus]
MYDEPGFSKSVGMPTICSGAPYPFVLLRLIFLFLPWSHRRAERPGAFLVFVFWFWVSSLFPFYSLGNGMGGGQSPPQGVPFFVLRVLLAAPPLSFVFLFWSLSFLRGDLTGRRAIAWGGHHPR